MALLLLSLLLVGCGEEGGAIGQLDLTDKAAKARAAESGRIARGGEIYRENCAVCHGQSGQGDPNWRIANSDGSRLPPPLNGSGHTWHHPEAWLVAKIKHGSKPGEGNMPPWIGILSDHDVGDVMAWFKSLWPAEIHQAWYRMEREKKER